MARIKKFVCDCIGDLYDFAGADYEAARWYLRGANYMQEVCDE